MSTATISPTAADLVVTFTGLGEFPELMGGNMGNFLVRREGFAAREVGVMVNNQAMAALAEELGQENNADFRQGIVRIVGRTAIEQLYRKSDRLDGVMVISAGTLREEPALVEAARAALASMPRPAVAVVELPHD